MLVRDWQAWVRLGVSDIVAPMSFHSRVALDYPVNLGGYRHPRDPGEPMVLHMVHVPGAPNSGLDARAQFRAGRDKLFEMTFADFEAKIRDELDRMLGPGGFSSARDILAITVNRWSHGYPATSPANSLFDPATTTTAPRCTVPGPPSAASPSQTPTPPATPTRISPSTRPRGRCANSWGGNWFAASTSLRKPLRRPG